MSSYELTAINTKKRAYHLYQSFGTHDNLKSQMPCSITVSIAALIFLRSYSRVVTLIEYTMSLTYPQWKKSRGVMSGDRGSQRIGPPLPIHLCRNSSIAQAHPHASVEVLHHVGRAGLGVEISSEGTQN